MVQIVKNNILKLGLCLAKNFTTFSNKFSKYTALLVFIKSYFKGGGYIYNEGQPSVYRISSRVDLGVLMCHPLRTFGPSDLRTLGPSDLRTFGENNYLLITKKFEDYRLFLEILDLFNRKAHLT